MFLLRLNIKQGPDFRPGGVGLMTPVCMFFSTPSWSQDRTACVKWPECQEINRSPTQIDRTPQAFGSMCGNFRCSHSGLMWLVQCFTMEQHHPLLVTSPNYDTGKVGTDADMQSAPNNKMITLINITLKQSRKIDPKSTISKHPKILLKWFAPSIFNLMNQ